MENLEIAFDHLNFVRQLAKKAKADLLDYLLQMAQEEIMQLLAIGERKPDERDIGR